MTFFLNIYLPVGDLFATQNVKLLEQRKKLP